MGLVLVVKPDTPDGAIVDVVDTRDPSMKETEVNDLRRLGLEPITPTPQTPMQDVVDKIIEKGEGKIALLRFHGHGLPGMQGIWVEAGKADLVYSGGLKKSDIRFSGMSITTENIQYLGPQLGRLQKEFVKGAWMQLHGCNVGEGPEGRMLLHKIANYTKVPVKAGIGMQFAGNGTTRTLEGMTYTAQPSPK